VRNLAFNGEFQHGIDEKGRLIMPVKFRDALGQACVICKGLEQCLFVYSIDEWTRIEGELDSLSVFKRSARDFKRRFFSGSSECDVDKQGRVNISTELRKYASIDKDVYVVGAGDHIEIWDKCGWDEYRANLDADYEKLAEELFS